MEKLEEDLVLIGASPTVEALFDCWIMLAKKRGALSVSYHLTPPFQSQLCPRTVVLHWGYPKEWVNLYSQYEFRKNDPIPDFVMRSGESSSWQIAVEQQKLSGKQMEFVQAMRDHDLKDAMAIPLFGANGRESFSSMSLGRTIVPEDNPIFRQMIAIGQVAHRRIGNLLKRDHSHKAKLSPRETEVLQWMVRGKSNADIATIMGISPTTVDTFVRRIFDKLNVNDRLAASFAGIARGLVRN